jgi:hypothetical protein
VAEFNLAERARATEAVLARFRDKPFDWAGANCIRLARAQAAALGHSVPPVPVFRTALGAKRALKKRGANSVSALLDAHFERWAAPAFARLGDLVAGPADPAHGLEAVGIADGQGNVWGWSQQNDHQAMVAILFANADLTAAWRL